MKGFLLLHVVIVQRIYSDTQNFPDSFPTLCVVQNLYYLFFLKNTRYCSQDYIWVNVRLKTTDYFVIVTDYFVYPGISLQDSKGWTSSPN